MAVVFESVAAGVSQKVPHRVKFVCVLVCHVLLELLFGAILEVFFVFNINRFTAYKINVTKTG